MQHPQSLTTPGTIFLEAYTRVDETARISGVALLPRISRNNNLYTKKELARFHNMQVPLNWEHDPAKQIGSVTFQFNAETEQVFYDGIITDEAAANLARNRTLYTSIEAEPTSSQTVCNGTDDCFNMPFGLKPVGLALTETPGVPETSVKLVESVIAECQADHDLEHKYAPNQTNLNNEDHIHDLLHKKEQEVNNPDADDQCVSAKISKLGDENPDMKMDQRIAIAISQCSEKESIKYLLGEIKSLKEVIGVCPDCGEIKKKL
jgi:hypothetical protein